MRPNPVWVEERADQQQGTRSAVPATITGIPDQEDIAGLVHRYLAYALIALVVLHAVAALKHHFINHDNTLRRMLGMSDKA